jgi:hypothetical protein
MQTIKKRRVQDELWLENYRVKSDPEDVSTEITEPKKHRDERPGNKKMNRVQWPMAQYQKV